MKKIIMWAVLSTAMLLLPNPQLNNSGTVASAQKSESAGQPRAVRIEHPAKPVTPQETVITGPETPNPEPSQPPVTQEVAQPPVADAEAEAKAFIYYKESTNNPAAENYLGCYGLGQDCNGIVKEKCGADYHCQDAFFTDYMLRRYGTWQKAKSFWLARVAINGRDVGHWW